ncbi:MAG TPA: tetratricopeptide repeat protein [Candidatus Polarisedimenticolaceae bacterium]|nr:tetratricopeptide repeat protein [Candidatus Polarisedimenticolaceae bacterium]
MTFWTAMLLTGSLAGNAVAAETATPPSAPTIRPDDKSAETLKRGDAYAHLIAAGLAVSRGRSGEAAHEVDQAVQLEPNSAELHAEGATLLAMLGRRADAERLARHALTLDSGQIEAIRVLADLAASRSFGPKADPAARAEAIRLFEQLSVIDTKAPDDIWSALARLKLAAGDNAGAVDAAQKLVTRRPGDADALRLLVQSLVAAHRTKEGLDTALGWLKAHPDDDDLMPLVVEMARETGEWAVIESMCDQLLANDPDNVRARALRGEAKLRQGRPKDALDDLELARASTPRDPMVRLHVAAAYQALHRLADATQIAESLSSEFPDNTFVRLLLAEVLARRGEVDDAREEYVAALRGSAGDEADDAERRDDIRLRIAAIDLSGEHPSVDDARQVLAKLEKPDDSDALTMRARAALAASDVKEARRLAKLLAPAEPVGAALLEGEAELSPEKVGRAQEKFDFAVTKGGPQVRGDVASIYRRHGHDNEAEKQLRAWVTAMPEDAEGRLALGALLERTDRFPAGEIELRQAMKLDPKSGEAFNYLGYSLADRGERLEEALDLVRKALAIDPWNGAYLDSLGWVYFKMDRLDDAREPLDRAVREFPRDPTVLEHLGDYYEKTGDAARAKGYWKRALAAGPETPQAKDALEKKIGAAPSVPAAAPAANQTAASRP